MKVIGLMIKPKVEELTNILMGPSMLETGKKTDSMDMELKRGQIMQNTKETTSTVKNMELAHLNGLMGPLILVSFTTIIFMAKVYIHGQITEFTKVNGDQIKCMVKELLHGPMEENMLENMPKIRNEGTVNLYGLMVDAIVVSG